MGAPSGRFIGDQEMFVFENNQAHVEPLYFTSVLIRMRIIREASILC
jgi:hypothetical protein